MDISMRKFLASLPLTILLFMGTPRPRMSS